jgi:hypothetical protein
LYVPIWRARFLKYTEDHSCHFKNIYNATGSLVH